MPVPIEEPLSQGVGFPQPESHTPRIESASVFLARSITAKPGSGYKDVRRTRSSRRYNRATRSPAQRADRLMALGKHDVFSVSPVGSPACRSPVWPARSGGQPRSGFVRHRVLMAVAPMGGSTTTMTKTCANQTPALTRPMR